jgi:hypothetical protein
MLQLSVVGGVSSDAQEHPKPSASSPTHKNNNNAMKDKNFYTHKQNSTSQQRLYFPNCFVTSWRSKMIE